MVVFCDGDFWHGRHWARRRSRLLRGANAAYWLEKIRYNMLRDRRQTRMLMASGWHVVRLWETDILSDIDAAVATVTSVLFAQRRKSRPATSKE